MRHSDCQRFESTRDISGYEPIRRISSKTIEFWIFSYNLRMHIYYIWSYKMKILHNLIYLWIGTLCILTHLNGVYLLGNVCILLISLCRYYITRIHFEVSIQCIFTTVLRSVPFSSQLFIIQVVYFDFYWPERENFY